MQIWSHRDIPGIHHREASGLILQLRKFILYMNRRLATPLWIKGIRVTCVSLNDWVMTLGGLLGDTGTLFKVIISYWMYLVINHFVFFPGALVWGINMSLWILTSPLQTLLLMPRVTSHVTIVFLVLNMLNVNHSHIHTHWKHTRSDNCLLARVFMWFISSFVHAHFKCW